MDVKPIYQEVFPDAIDLADRTFELTPPGAAGETSALKFDPATLALLHPPLLLATPAGKMLVIGGRSILSALEPNTSLGCLLFPAETSRATILALALAAILSQRQATPMEQAICWEKAEEWLGKEEAWRRFGPLLELTRRYPPSRLARLKDLPENQANALQTGRLELSTAFQLLDLDKKSSALLYQVIELLHLSSSNQKKLLEICRDLAGRDGIAIAELLNRPEGREILSGAMINPPQQAVRLLAWLNELRRPRLSAANHDWQIFTASLSLPTGVTLEPSPSFERDTMRLTIELPGRQTLSACWPALREVLRGCR